MSRNYYNYIIGLMVKFGLPVLELFGLPVKNSAFQFSNFSAFWIRPNGPVRIKRTFGKLYKIWDSVYI